MRLRECCDCTVPKRRSKSGAKSAKMVRIMNTLTKHWLSASISMGSALLSHSCKTGKRPPSQTLAEHPVVVRQNVHEALSALIICRMSKHVATGVQYWVPSTSIMGFNVQPSKGSFTHDRAWECTHLGRPVPMPPGVKPAYYGPYQAKQCNKKTGGFQPPQTLVPGHVNCRTKIKK